MSNMSYCRFQNTLSDLRDCQLALSDLSGAPDPFAEMSEAEVGAARKLIRICREIADDWGDEAR